MLRHTVQTHCARQHCVMNNASYRRTQCETTRRAWLSRPTLLVQSKDAGCKDALRNSDALLWIRTFHRRQLPEPAISAGSESILLLVPGVVLDWKAPATGLIFRCGACLRARRGQVSLRLLGRKERPYEIVLRRTRLPGLAKDPESSDSTVTPMVGRSSPAAPRHAAARKSEAEIQDRGL